MFSSSADEFHRYQQLTTDLASDNGEPLKEIEQATLPATPARSILDIILGYFG